MSVQELIKQYSDSVQELGVLEENRLGGIALNCLSLTEAWLQRQNEKTSLVLRTYDEEGGEIDCSYGITKDNLPLELLSTCMRPNKVKNVKLFKYAMRNGMSNSELLGELSID